MKTYNHRYCANCGKMNTIDPRHPHKKCKFCHQYLWPPIITTLSPTPISTDPDHDNDIDTPGQPDVDTPTP